MAYKQWVSDSGIWSLQTVEKIPEEFTVGFRKNTCLRPFETRLHSEETIKKNLSLRRKIYQKAK